MRKLVLVFGFLPLLLLRCGTSNDDCQCPADSGSDATTDGAKNDAAPPADAGNDVVATDASEAGLACTSPAGCEGGATPLCCGTVVLNGGSPPSCTTTSVTSACAAQCTTAFVSNCNGTETVQLCAQGPDCNDPTYDKCCTFTSGNESLTFCTSQSIATGAGATCK